LPTFAIPNQKFTLCFPPYPEYTPGNRFLMRLLQIEADGEFSLTDFVGIPVPEYAILSHTWGQDCEEVTFKELTEGKPIDKTKLGYRKLIFCGEQAATDGLQFFWVDTCCIDKSSSAELAEAINSMFRWYQNSARCYVYLSDISSDAAENSQSFHESRWFTRGWTLQELLASKSVEFFSVERHRFGDKSSMAKEIQAITEIPIQALNGTNLSLFSVDERMSWADKRKTKRPEDAAYSLMGIFDVNIPILYGEGKKKAFTRLRKEIEETQNNSIRIAQKPYVCCP